METKELVDRLFDRCYRLIARRPRSRKEVEDYIKRKAFRLKRVFKVEEIISLTIKRLEEQGLVNDTEFVSWWVEQRTYFRPKGIRALKQELLKKGMSKQVIDNYLDDNPVDEKKMAIQVLSKRWPRFQTLPLDQRAQKAQRFLLSRGFSYETAKKTFALLEKKE